MDIKQITNKLLKIYEEIDQVFLTYQKSTGLNCPKECGKCCLNPEIEATALEMIPFALFLLENNQIDSWLVELQNSENPLCPLYKLIDSNGKGYCGYYEFRPAICRMFGVSGLTDKHQQKTLSICKVLKENYASLLQDVLKNSDSAPQLREWMGRIDEISPFEKKLPIKMAVQNAIEKVALYASLH